MEREFPWIETITLLVTVVLVGLLFFAGLFIQESTAQSALEKQGFTDTRIIEKQWFMVGMRGCDRSDVAKFTVRVVNPAQKAVELFVCVGWPFKGATIRSN